MGTGDTMRDSFVEEVVLLAADGSPIGTAPKATVHTVDTPLHLAFSCYVFDEDDRLLVTQRASAKRTWPGVWTNSCCGHPAPGEDVSEAVGRRLKSELGIAVTDLAPALPDFRYRAVMANGIVENEVCPVFRASVPSGTLPRPDPEEVDGYRWIPWPEFADDVLAGRFEVSPWCRLQVEQLVDVISIVGVVNAE
jgi:isopentenyl-diphosphate delta-isomerase